MRAGRVFMVIVGSVLALVAIGLLVGGGAILWAFNTQRDAAGYFNSPSYQIASDGYAIVTSEVELASHPGDWWPSRVAGTVRLQVRATGGTPVFVGIGSTEQVTSYLSGVARKEVTDLGTHLRAIEATTHTGGAPTTPPGQQALWTASVEGTGEQVLTWKIERGRWTAVIMNADATAPVSVSAVAGVNLPVLEPIGIGLLAGGFVFALVASLLIAGATRRGGLVHSPSESPCGAHPARVQGTLDEPLSPALWLVKWFLAIPHYVVLVFLFAAFAVLTVFSWVAILFTGRYPRGMFDFNVGVIRWAWRVGFYSYSALGTDRYPPFTLEDADYPARFSIPYPERLSRGLALVKWWLLAIPHYLIVGAFTSGLVFWTSQASAQGDNPVWQLGGGLIGLLVILSGFALLFTGRYPRGLYNLVMGLNRWSLRVLTYAALMTDAYPPFRLDMGGGEPDEPQGAPPEHPPAPPEP
jgi:hypothetical protein